MSRIAYVGGEYLPQSHARISIDDRAFQFADGVYEVVTVINNRLIDEARHLARLHRSLRELRIDPPMAEGPMRFIMREVLRRNRVTNGLLYLQISRGAARRDHPFPDDAVPLLVMTARSTRRPPASHAQDGIPIILIADIRWRRCDIKSTSLLPNVLGKQTAVEAGAYEAWMTDDDGMITEGTASNAWIISADGHLVTRQLSDHILGGVTRSTVLDLARAAQLPIEERAFSVAELDEAREAFLTSASSFVLPVTSIDGKPVGDGRPGSHSLALRSAYEEFMAGQQQI